MPPTTTVGVLAAAELELLGVDVAEAEPSLEADAVLATTVDEADPVPEAAVEALEAGGE